MANSQSPPPAYEIPAAAEILKHKAFSGATSVSFRIRHEQDESGAPLQQVQHIHSRFLSGQQPLECVRLFSEFLGIGLLKSGQVVQLPSDAREVFQVRHLQQRPLGLVGN
jgi:hypothetical protein